MKNDIAFIFSDASYSQQSKIAGIGVVDLQTQKTYKKSIQKINGPLKAEEYALAYSIKYAQEQGYKHVIFVYDALQINIDVFRNYAEKRFASAQFLWLNRNYNKKADAISKTVRKLKEQTIENFRYERRYFKELKDNELLDKFKSYSDEAIIQAFINTSNRKRQLMLKYYLENYGNHKSYVFQIKKKDVSFFKNIYYFLSKKHREYFANYVIDQCVDVIKFKELRKRECYLNSIENLIEKMDKNKYKTNVNMKLKYRKDKC